MNSVVKVVIRLFDEGKVSLDVAKEIIYMCREGVGYCDGNEYEALDCIALVDAAVV